LPDGIKTHAINQVISQKTERMRKDIEQTIVQETVAIWTELFGSIVSEEEAKDIISNTTSLFDLLDQWDRDSQTAHNTSSTADERIGGKHAA
jgi:hypothetical protein